MLSYQHSYHAGNFADLIKHMVLVYLLKYQSIKDAPYFYLDTHAGRGIYDLQSADALKKCEFQSGIQKLWMSNEHVPPLVQEYLDIVQAFNPHQILRFYPGSLAIALQLQRSHDRAYATELHPGEFAQLSLLETKNKRIFIEKADGLKTLCARLPPLEKRGIIFIDPSFEVKSEYRAVPASIAQAYRKFPTGIFCLWFPVVDQTHHEQLCRGLQSITGNSLRIEFELDSSLMRGMRRSGLWIANPPFLLKDQLETALSFIVEQVYQNQAKFFLYT